jgi:hypothetical protein
MSSSDNPIDRKLKDELFLFFLISCSSSAFRYCGGDGAERIDFDVERFDDGSKDMLR